MRTNKKHHVAFTGFAMIVLFLCAFIYSRQNNPIVGTWVGLHSSNQQINQYSLSFTSDNNFKHYFGGQLTKYNKYKLSRTPNHCGVDMSKRLQMYPDEQILILINTKTGKKQCNLVYQLTSDRLILAAFRNAHIDTLKKVQR